MAIALVQSAEGTSASSSVSPAFSGASTAGNLIVLGFAADDYNGTPDTGWTQSAEMEIQGFHGGYIWWRISTGETSFSYTIGSATNSAWVLAEFSGCDDTDPYDISESQFTNTSGTTQATPTITPTTGERVLVAMVGGSLNSDLTGNYGAWTDSFTDIASGGSNGAGTNDCCGLAYRLVTGDGSTTFSTTGDYTGGTSCQSRSGLIISFKEAPAAEEGGRYLLESGAPDGYLLEDGTGVLLMEGGSAAQDLSPSLYSDADTFFSPTVTTGAVGLTPSLYTDTDTFHTPTITSSVGLTPSLYTDADTFFTPTVTVGSVDLTPSLYSDADTFFTPAITTGAVNLDPSLYSDADTFFTPTVGQGGGAQDLTPSLYSDADTFFTPAITTGSVGVSPSLFVNSAVFFVPIVDDGTGSGGDSEGSYVYGLHSWQFSHTWGF